MPALSPRTALRLGCYGVAGLLLALGIRSLAAPSPADNPAYDALSHALTRRIAADSVALAAADSALAAAHASVTRTVTRYQELRDTLNIHDTLQVIVFRDRADSVKRSCVAEDNSCARFRIRADSSIAGLTLDRDRWKLQAESERPSWLRKALPYLAFGAGLYVGSRVTR